ncbi:DNA-directed RNA polymerase core subunit rpc40 [Paramarasmius palmivorus]|uniref:DNA-directed RNA polymerases I and III subunit RPAC1 n=1 Tax=Paramarasmius palmivorus TaxID=297713 RepID=A0AAW0EEN0_9AGAR
MSAYSLHDVQSSRLVKITPERARDVSSTDYPGHHADASPEEYQWDLDKFKKNLRVQVTRLSNRSIEFDLVGVDASIANAFRRILIAEVPSIAIERFYVWNNTSVIQDEVLAHRLGLVPLNVDPGVMDFRGPEDPPTDRNTLVFKADFTCQKNPAYKPSANTTTPPKHEEMFINHEFRAEHLIWYPAGEQEDTFQDNKPASTNGNIVLAKLRPGQNINIECHAVKGVGKDHAKFSPVATASYRLHPYIKITKPIPPHRAEEFKRCFSPGVVKVNSRKEVSIDLQGMRNDTVSREVLRDPEFKDSVELARIRDWFIFQIESESAYKPERLMNEAVKVMRSKIDTIKQAAEALREQHDGDVTMGGT